MKNICTINHNGEDRRITIAWSEDDKSLYAIDLGNAERLEETAETLGEAYETAGYCWGYGELPWELQTIEPGDDEIED